MKSWSLYLGRYFGIEIFIHWSFWILIVWIFLMNLGSGGTLQHGLRGVFFILALFICVVLHEFGHALTAKRFGAITKNITLYPIGGVAALETLPQKPGQELLVGLAGPAVNLIIASIILLYLKLTGQALDMTAINESSNVVQMPFLWSLFFANTILAIFNLLPAFPMDGGRVFRSFLAFFMERPKATRIAAGLGQFLAIIFVFLGFFYNFWLVIIGLFIFIGAGGEAAYEQTKAALGELTVKDALIRRFTVLKPGDTLARAVDALLNSQETEFIVVDAEKPVGLLTRNEIIKGLSEKGKDAPVSNFMNPNFFVVASETKLRDFFVKVLEKGQAAAIVMDGNRLRGLIDRENIEEKLMIQDALKIEKNG